MTAKLGAKPLTKVRPKRCVSGKRAGEEIRLAEPVEAKYVRISMKQRPAQNGAKARSSQWTPGAFSLWEVQINN